MLYKSKTFELLELSDIVGFIVGMFYEYWFMGPSGRFNHRPLYWTVWVRFYAFFFIWVELPVQRRLCPIFLKNVRSPDIHEYSAG